MICMVSFVSEACDFGVAGFVRGFNLGFTV